MADEEEKVSEPGSDNAQSSAPQPPADLPDKKTLSGGLNRVLKKLGERAYRTIIESDTTPKDGKTITQSSLSEENSPAFTSQQQPPPGSATSGVNHVAKKTGEHAFKTILDLDACRRVTEEITLKKMAEIADNFRAGPSDRVVQPIDHCRAATYCGAKWADMSGTDCFKICRQCGLHVYNFSQVSLEDANALVMQREGIENPTFYRRYDGKFLTKDCPVGVIRKGKSAARAAIGAVAVIAVISAVALAPRPSLQTSVAGPAVVAGQSSSAVKSGTSSTKTLPLKTIQISPEVARSTAGAAPAAQAPSNMLRKFKPMLNHP